MLTEEDLIFLMKNFGTIEIGNCSQCMYFDKHKKYKVGFPCGQEQCEMTTRLLLHKTRNQTKSKDCTPKTKKLVNKLSKMDMLGYEKEVVSPWVLFRSANSSMWLNPELQVTSTKSYPYIEVLKNNIVCYNHGLEADTDLEMYSIYSGEHNILEGLENVSRDQFIRNLLKFKGQDKTLRDLGIVQFFITDNKSNTKMTLLASSTGNRLIIPFDKALEFVDRGKILGLYLGRFKKTIKVSKDLKLIDKQVSLPVLEV